MKYLLSFGENNFPLIKNWSLYLGQAHARRGGGAPFRFATLYCNFLHSNYSFFGTNCKRCERREIFNELSSSQRRERILYNSALTTLGWSFCFPIYLKRFFDCRWFLRSSCCLGLFVTWVRGDAMIVCTRVIRFLQLKVKIFQINYWIFASIDSSSEEGKQQQNKKCAAKK